MSIFGNVSPEWLEEQYQQWKSEPQQVSPDWQAFFEGFDLARQTPVSDSALATKNSAVDSLIYRYRDLGHLQADTDPLSPEQTNHVELNLAAFGLTEADLDQTFYPLRFPKQSATLREIIELLKETYCGAIGVEFMHIQDPTKRDWLKQHMEEKRNQPQMDRDEQLHVLEKLQEATLFEAFLHRKFLGQKRFSLEGGEVIIPLLDSLLTQAAQRGVSDLIMGMSHRGRLNVLANIFDKPLENLFAEFKDNLELAFVGDGDVKYHKGYSTDRSLPAGHNIHLSLAANPSHLEAVDPVVIGKCRARHVSYGPGGRKRVLPVIAFACLPLSLHAGLTDFNGTPVDVAYWVGAGDASLVGPEYSCSLGKIDMVKAVDDRDFNNVVGLRCSYGTTVRRIAIQGLVCSPRMVVIQIRRHKSLEMPLVEHNNVVEKFSA